MTVLCAFMRRTFVQCVKILRILLTIFGKILRIMGGISEEFLKELLVIFEELLAHAYLIQLLQKFTAKSI